MNTFKIQIAPWLYEELKIGRTTYVEKPIAIDVLTEALNKNEIKFRIVHEKNRTCFLNESDGALAVIIPA